MQPLTKIQSQLLRGAVADLQAMRSGQSVPGVVSWREIQQATEDAAAGLVRLATARWLGVDVLPPAGRMAATRAYRKLEARGLVVRRAERWASERANYVEILPAGIQLAAEHHAERNETNGPSPSDLTPDESARQGPAADG
jgi:hypothetical protein